MTNVSFSQFVLLVLIAALALAGCAAPDGAAAPQAWIDAPLHESARPVAPLEIVLHGADPGGINFLEVTVQWRSPQPRPPEDPRSPWPSPCHLGIPDSPVSTCSWPGPRARRACSSAETSSVVTLTGGDAIAQQPARPRRPVVPLPRARCRRGRLRSPPRRRSTRPPQRRQPSPASSACASRPISVSYEGGVGCRPLRSTSSCTPSMPMGSGPSSSSTDLGNAEAARRPSTSPDDGSAGE